MESSISPLGPHSGLKGQSKRPLSEPSRKHRAHPREQTPKLPVTNDLFILQTSVKGTEVNSSQRIENSPTLQPEIVMDFSLILWMLGKISVLLVNYLNLGPPDQIPKYGFSQP